MSWVWRLAIRAAVVVAMLWTFLAALAVKW